MIPPPTPTAPEVLRLAWSVAYPLDAGEILQRLLVTAVREKLQFVARLLGRGGLMPRFKFHFLPGAQVADGLKREGGQQDPTKPRADSGV